MTGRKITFEMLRAAGACYEQLDDFETHFPADQYPDGVEVTEELALEHAEHFDWYYGVFDMRLLEGAALVGFEEAAKAASEVLIPAQDAARDLFDQQIQQVESELPPRPKWTMTNGEKRAAWHALRAVAVAPYNASYNQAMDAASAEYNRKLAVAFAKAWNLT